MNAPFWRGQEVVQEPVVLFEQKGHLQGRLLFRPIQIRTVEVWVEGRGFVPSDLVPNVDIHQERAIYFDSGSRSKLPFLHKGSEIRPLGSPDSYPATRDGKQALMFSETGLFHRLQVRVSYTHRETWAGVVPSFSLKKLPRTREMCSSGRTLDLFVFGDSISAGANCSKSLALPPYQGSYPELLERLLAERYPRLRVQLKNESVGGQSSEWGARQLPGILKDAGDFRFDLNILAWGMNDSTGKRPAKRFMKNIAKHVKLIWKQNPMAEFLLVGSSLPNDLWNGTHTGLLSQYVQGLAIFARERGLAVECANLTRLWEDLLARKNYHDLTGNGVNHPNDFGHQIYAQFLGTLLGAYNEAI